MSQDHRTETKSPDEDPNNPEIVEAAKCLLQRKFKIQVKDGRVFVGEFTCIDKQGNIILNNAYEEQLLHSALQQKQMGQLLVPANHRVSCHVLPSSTEEADHLRRLLQ